MSQNPSVASGQENPFQRVERISDEIFDKLIEIDHVEDLSPKQAAATKSRLQKLGNFLLEAAPKLGTADEQSISDTQPEFDFAVMVDGEETGDYFSLSRAAGERQKARNAGQSLAEMEAARVSYHAARARSKLPEGIELLEGRAANVSEPDMISAIKAVMVENKKSPAGKRLPDLAPAQAQRPQTAAAPSARPKRAIAHAATAQPHSADPERVRAAFKRGLPHRIASFLLRDTILATSLAVWAALLAMAFIDRSVTDYLLGISLYLLVVYVLVSRHRSLLSPMTVVGKLSARNMGGRAGA